MNFEIWGNSLGAAYLALRLHKIGAEVQWIRSPDGRRGFPVRPVRLGSDSRALFRELQSSFLRPLHFWKSALSFRSWTFEAGLHFQPLSTNLNGVQDTWIPFETLMEEIEQLRTISRIPVMEKDCVTFSPKEFRQSKCIQIVDFSPEEMESYRGTFFPEKLSRPQLFQRCWEFESGETLRSESSISLHSFAGSRGILETSQGGRSYLTLFAPTHYALDRAEFAVSEPRGGAPMRWKAIFLQSQKRQYQELQIRLGPSHFEIPGVFRLGSAIGEYRPWSNLRADQSLLQAERAFRRLFHLAALKDPVESSRVWHEAESGRFRGYFRRSQWTEDLIYSSPSQKWLSSASMLLPSRVRNYLNLPV
jgi:hypothetical protein